MVSCELCGKDAKLIRTNIENIELSVCQACSSFGEPLQKNEGRNRKTKNNSFNQRSNHFKKKKEQIEEVVIKNYASKIRNKREYKGLKQEDFAKMLNEKESVIQKIETGHLVPSIALAKKLERILGIRLIEKEKVKDFVKESSNSGAVTIGDLIKFKKN